MIGQAAESGRIPSAGKSHFQAPKPAIFQHLPGLNAIDESSRRSFGQLLLILKTGRREL